MHRGEEGQVEHLAMNPDKSASFGLCHFMCMCLLSSVRGLELDPCSKA